MATIQNGYNDEPFTINIANINKGTRTAELWTIMRTGSDDEQERLHYVTLSELLNLRDQIQDAIREMTKL